MLVVMKSNKEMLNISAPFRLGAYAPGSTDLRIFRDCVPESRVPGLCVALFFSSADAAAQWMDFLSNNGATASPAPAADPVLHVINGSTWARLPDVNLAQHGTVAAVLDFIVNRHLREIPTDYRLCFSQPSSTNVFSQHSVVFDNGVCFHILIL